MEYIKENTFGIKPDIYINNVDYLFKALYERKKSVEEVMCSLNIYDEVILNDYKIDESEIIKSLSKFTKTQLKKFNYKIKEIKSIKNAKYYYSLLAKIIDDSNLSIRYKKTIEIIGNITFNDISGINFDLNKEHETKKEKIECYLINAVKSFIETNSINNKTIDDFIRLNHIQFYTNDEFQFLCLKFFLIINDFIYEKYDSFTDYNEYIMNLYYLYYKYIKKNNLNEFKENILSKIDPDNYSQFSFDKNVLTGKYLAILTMELENLINNNKSFKLKIDENLLNNPILLRLFNLNRIDKDKIKKFFKFSIIKDNYSKFLKNINGNFEISIDTLDYDESKLSVFNNFFVVCCGLIDKIGKDSLQIFNEDNNVIQLFKKYATILINNINDIIESIKNKNNNLIMNEEIFGFGKIFNTFYVLYTNLNSNLYDREKLKFDLVDNMIQKNINTQKILKINIKLNKSENDTNFTNKSEDSNKNLSEEQSYYEKVNSTSLEDQCKEYIFSKINDIINENKGNIELIELYRILFGLNYFIPYIDENYSLRFIPVTKKMFEQNSEQEYGYHEFDCMFKVLGNNDIPMNQINNANNGLPFAKSFQLKINSVKEFSQMKFDIKLEDEKEFSIKKNALVIVENKIRFPKKIEKIVEYISIMLKKLNFVIKLIKNTTKDFHVYKNIQLLLIYDEIICDSEDLLKYITVEQIKSILTNIPFTENAKFTIEIIYISQVVNTHNISKYFKELRNMKSIINELKEKVKNLENNQTSNKEIPRKEEENGEN